MPYVEDIIVIGDNDTDDVVTFQKWSVKKESIDVDGVTPDKPIVSEESEVRGTIHNLLGHRRSARLA